VLFEFPVATVPVGVFDEVRHQEANEGLRRDIQRVVLSIHQQGWVVAGGDVGWTRVGKADMGPHEAAICSPQGNSRNDCSPVGIAGHDPSPSPGNRIWTTNSHELPPPQLERLVALSVLPCS
jgi:hypothetical protein